MLSDQEKKELKQQIELKINSKNSSKDSSPIYIANEIKKLSELRDDGVLSNEEFDSQKSILLSNKVVLSSSLSNC